MTLVLKLPTVDEASKLGLPSNFVAPPAPCVRRLAQFGAGHRRYLFPPLSAAMDEKDPKSPTTDRPSGAGQRDTGDRKKFVKLEPEDLEEDWYAFLKLPNSEGSSDDEIRGAYRRRCLETHPDKQPDGSDLEFKKVQRAFEILGNAEARRSYDSSRPFDDSIPREEVDEGDFYKVFGPVFERNKKWSALPHTPSLGDDDTPVAAVRKMYDTWLAFRSWRDFSNEVDLQEIDEGMMREEKRFYMRENQRMLDQRNKDELRRVRTLVDRAMKNDPRLRRHREAEEAARQQVIAQRNAARDAAEEAERHAKEAAAAKERQEAEDRKQAIVNMKQQRQQNIKEMVDFFIANQLIDEAATNLLLPLKVRKPNIQWVLSNATLEETATFKESITSASAVTLPDGSGVPAVLKFNELIAALEERVGRNRYGEAVKKGTPTVGTSPVTKMPPAAAAPEAVVWTEEDLTNLQKASTKYPGGAVDRWRRIAVALHNKFTEEQVLEQLKIMEVAWRQRTNSGVTEAPSAPPPAEAEEWTPKQQKQLEQGLREMKDYKEKDKFTKVATYVENKTAKQCFDRFKYLCAMAKK